ncbi:hypothetical protein [Ramlibacter sp.]|uniref:hypothetical protein n=1 Tax=Ramlibacter sp. TaxID=1917967 RepID=UPI003D12B804
MMRFLCIALAAMALSACGEKPQTATGIKSDTTAFSGTGMAYQAPGWKAGDKASWEQQLKTRTQNGQNDYAKVN